MSFITVASIKCFSFSTISSSVFRAVEKRLHGAKAKVSELAAKSKQRYRKGSHEQVYKERDALLSHLHNSYLAFEEKFGENEKLKKTIQELLLSQKQAQGGMMQVCNFNFFFVIVCMFRKQGVEVT